MIFRVEEDVTESRTVRFAKVILAVGLITLIAPCILFVVQVVGR